MPSTVTNHPRAGFQLHTGCVNKVLANAGMPYTLSGECDCQRVGIQLTHYCRVEIPHEGRKPTYEIHPATLYLRRIRWLCYNCYSKQKTYNARMQDDSKLVDKEDKKLTLQVKEHLGQQAMHMEINTLAEIFDISPHTVDKCFDKAVDKYDKERDWDNISTLGLYTITLNVQGQQADCCLCANVDTEKLIEFFLYEDTKAAEAFLSKLKNKQNIQRVFTSIDSAAFDFAKTNFPIETIMVDRLNVRKRLLNGLETVKKGNMIARIILYCGGIGHCLIMMTRQFRPTAKTTSFSKKCWMHSLELVLHIAEGSRYGYLSQTCGSVQAGK